MASGVTGHLPEPQIIILRPGNMKERIRASDSDVFEKLSQRTVSQMLHRVLRPLWLVHEEPPHEEATGSGAGKVPSVCAVGGDPPGPPRPDLLRAAFLLQRKKEKENSKFHQKPEEGKCSERKN